MPRCPGCSVSSRSSVTLQSVSSGHSVSVSFSACRKGPRLCDWSRCCLCFSSPLVYRARPFYLCLVRHSQDYLCPVSNVANAESNEIRLENIDISGHILLALFSINFTLVSHYSAFSSVPRFLTYAVSINNLQGISWRYTEYKLSSCYCLVNRYLQFPFALACSF